MIDYTLGFEDIYIKKSCKHQNITGKLPDIIRAVAKLKF